MQDRHASANCAASLACGSVASSSFPCGWFYFVADDHVDVVRLLADAQDLPTILAEVAHE